MKRILAIALLALVFGMGAAHAQRTPVPIINHENVAIVTSGSAKPTADAVKKAIMTAATEKNWTVSHVAGRNALQAQLNVRGKHTVVVEIELSDTTYSIRYVNSINMKYKVEDGVPVIHPFYNRWVSQLMDTIRAELLKI